MPMQAVLADTALLTTRRPKAVPNNFYSLSFQVSSHLGITAPFRCHLQTHIPGVYPGFYTSGSANFRDSSTKAASHPPHNRRACSRPPSPPPNRCGARWQKATCWPSTGASRSAARTTSDASSGPRSQTSQSAPNPARSRYP